MECPLSNILFQKDPGNTCVPKFSSKSYNCDNDYQPSGMEVNGGEWVTITFPEAFVIADFLITADESDSPPGEIVIYGLDPDLVIWMEVWSGSANVNTDVFIDMSRKIEMKFYTYRLVVTELTSMVGSCTEKRSLSFNRWSLRGIACEKGKYADNDNGGSCTECPRGSYSTSNGRTKCLQCPDNCLLYTSPSPRDLSTSRMPSSA